MKTNKIFTIIAILMVASFLLAACGSSTPDATAQPAVQTASTGSGSEVIVEGRVVPQDFANLYFSAPGKVAEVLVKEGDLVTKGSVLVRLGDRENHEANLVAAQAEVTSAQQALDTLTRTASLAFSQALFEEGKAEQAYYAALIAWDVFDETKYEDDLDQAKADVSTTKRELEDAQDEFAKYASLDKDNPDRKRTKDDMDAAQKKYDDALASQSDIENEYTGLQATLAAAKASLDEATRTRQNRTDGPDKDQLALAQARLDVANARLTAAQTALANLDLKAPYDGTVARLDISAGESVNANQTVIVLADMSQWYIETTDLTENEVVDVKVGQLVTIVPDALPDLELNGVVERIGQTYTEKSGDIVYSVRIRITADAPKLRWGMTVETRFIPE